MASHSPQPPPPPKASGIQIGDVGRDVNFNALGDIVGGDKITNITTTIQISVEAVTQRPLVRASPYRGLDRFEDKDKDLFFGRDQLIKSLLTQLSTSNVLLVLGASGSGKSSVVRAGLLPHLSQLIGPRFRYFAFVPDINPFESLRSALQAGGFNQTQTRELLEAKPETTSKLIRSLQRDGDQWLLFVDQFEEIFTVSDEKWRARFIGALVRIAQEPESSTKLVLAMRADFLDRFSPFPEFAKIVEKNIDFVADMYADELRLVIEQPAARHGVVYEQGLVEEIITGVQGEAGSLPLLQYTLNLLWEKEAQQEGLTDRHLNTVAYRELGGVRGALQKRADEIFASFGDSARPKEPTPQQLIVRQIFLRLVDLAGESSNEAAWRPVRRRTPMATFATEEEQKILQALIDHKLLVSNREGSDATVEVAHEALFTAWGKLRGWIQAGKQVIFARNRLADDARRWQRRKEAQDSGADEELLSGSRLAQALDMRARGDFATVTGGLSNDESLFLDHSAAQREKRRRLRRILEVVGVALLLISIAGAIFGWAGQRTAASKEKEAQKAAKEAKHALSQTDFLRATDLIAENKTSEALAFLARACRTEPENSNAATRLFSLIVQRNWVLPLTKPVKHTAGELVLPWAVEHVAFSPDGTKFVTNTFYEGKAYVWEAETGRSLLGAIPGNTGSHNYDSRPPLPDERSFSPRDPWLLVTSGQQVRIADFAAGQVRVPVLEHAANVTAAQFSPDGALVQTGDAKGKVVMWDAQSGGSRREIKLPGPVLAFNRDGTRAITALVDDLAEGIEPAVIGLEAWKLEPDGNSSRLPLKAHGKFLALSPDGQRMCSWTHREGELTQIHFWDVTTGAEQTAKLENLPPDPESIERAKFSSTSQFVVTAAFRRAITDANSDLALATGRIRVWDATTAKQVAAISHETTPVNALDGFHPYRASLSPDMLRVASVALEDRALRISAAQNGTALNEPPCTSDEFTGVAFRPDGTQILTGSFSGNAQTWDIRPTAPIDDPVRIAATAKRGFKTARISQDGTSVLFATEEGEQSCFDTKTGQSIDPIPAEFATPDPASHDSTRQRAFEPSRGDDATRRLIDVPTGRPLEPEVGIWSSDEFRFSADGQGLLIINRAMDIPSLTLRNAKTGALLRPPIIGVSNGWFSPSGDRVVILSTRGLAVLDLATGRDLIDPLPYPGAIGAVLLADGLMVVDSGGLIHRFPFLLDRAPALLPELAEAIGQHTLNEFGVPDPQPATISTLRLLQAKPQEPKTPSVFAAWLKWFFAARDTRPINPASTKTLLQYLQQCLERGTPESLAEAELLAIGNKEMLAAIAEKKRALPGP